MADSEPCILCDEIPPEGYSWGWPKRRGPKRERTYKTICEKCVAICHKLYLAQEGNIKKMRDARKQLLNQSEQANG